MGKISALAAASTLTGTEEVPVVQSGSNVRTTAAAIAALAAGGVSSVDGATGTVTFTTSDGTVTITKSGDNLDFKATGGGGGGGGGPTLAHDFISGTSSFTPTIGQKYSFVCQYSLTGGYTSMRAQLQTPSNQAFEVAILSGTTAALNYSGSSVTETNLNILGSATVGNRTIVCEFTVYSGNLLDFRGFCDGLYAGAAYQVSLTSLSSEPLTPYYYTDSPTPTSAKIYQGYVVTELAGLL